MSGVRAAVMVGIVGFVAALSIDASPDSPVPPHTRSTFEPLETDFADYTWPTTASRIVTSTFGEYRASHFHAGIDISAGDINGYPVFASRAGEVTRIRIGATGYGKILVIRHADGYTTSYAHLQKFAGPIEERARREQLRLERYQIDIHPAPGELRVAKGQIVAYSGETGSGSPHLHFELRDPNNNPVNPFLAPNLRTFDNIAPTISRIAVAPADPASTVNGGSGDIIIPVPAPRQAVSAIHYPLTIVGGATFSVDVRDRIPRSRFRNGIYRNVLTIDGDTAYAIRLDRLPAGPVHEIGLQFDWGLIDEGRGRFQRLFMLTPNDLPTYTPRTIPAGIVDGTRYGVGKHRYAIASSDFAGNTTIAAGEFLISREPIFEAVVDTNALRVRLLNPQEIRTLQLEILHSAGSWVRSTYPAPRGGMPAIAHIGLPPGGIEAVMIRAENFDGVVSAPTVLTLPHTGGRQGLLRLSAENSGSGVRLTVASDGTLASPVAVTAFEGSRSVQIPCRSLDQHTAAGWYVPGFAEAGRHRFVARAIVDGTPQEAGTELAFFPVLPSTTGQLRLDGEDLVITYDSLSVLSPLFLEWSKRIEDGDRIYTLGPGYPVLGGGMRVTLRDPISSPHRALFFRGRGGWSLIGGRDGSAPTSGMLSSTLGELAILTDDSPPTISGFSLEGSRSRFPRLRFRYRDDLAGVEYDSLKTYLDGNVVIADVDGEHRRATVTPSVPLARGTHRLTIRIADKMGNQSTVERRFTLR